MLAKTFPGSFWSFLGQVGTHCERNINTEFHVFLEAQTMHVACRTKGREGKEISEYFTASLGVSEGIL